MSFSLHTAPGGPEYLTSGLFDGARHCFSTRNGGVSAGALESLNLGIHRGDRPGNVLKNYRLLGKAVGFAPNQLVFTRQIHADIVRRVGRADRGQGLFFPAGADCDALITDEPGTALTVFSADCTPILLFDPVRGAIGAVHSGWRGTALGIAGKTVAAMERAYGCRPEDIRAAVGPCISACCFETRQEVPQAMEAALGALALPAIRQTDPEHYHVDLKLLNCVWLELAGVRLIDVSPQCTCCEPERFWSHRRTGQQRGSMAAVICLDRRDAL